MTSTYEVELKFPAADLAAVTEKLVELGAAISAAHEEADLYFAHPAKDFARTDEALRLRRKGDKYFITYKGPKIDSTTKTRREIELHLPVADDTMDAWTGLLEALGFSRVAEVRKSRRKAFVQWQGQRIEVSLDKVPPLGTFVELELLADEQGVEAAKACIRSLASELGLSGSERRSYLELLLGDRASRGDTRG
jgi:adenylate cyclase, class 2